MLSLNQKAKLSIQPLVDEPDGYRVLVARTGAGATLIDCGVKAPGSFGAGVLFSRACLAGLAEISVTTAALADLTLPLVNVSVDRPVEACMASQYAGWAINKGGYFAMASGPARALAAGEDLFDEISHVEKSDEAVICLEAGAYPTDEAEEYILKKTGVRPENLTILVARTASITGSVQIAARIVETAIHKMHEIGFALDSVIHGAGSCPAAPVAADDMTAIGRTNDMVLYAGSVTLTVDCDDGFLDEKIGLIPSSASKDYGRTFGELFREYGDFYKIDPMLFSPASVTLVNARSGRVYSAGSVNENMITKSLRGG